MNLAENCECLCVYETILEMLKGVGGGRGVMYDYLDKILRAARFRGFSIPELRQLGRDHNFGQHVGQFGLRLSVDRSTSVDRNDLQNRSSVRV